MKILILIPFLILSSKSFSQDRRIELKTNCKGPVKSVIESKYNIVWDSCTPEKYYLQRNILTFNRGGYMVEDLAYYSDTITFSSKTVNAYTRERITESSSTRKIYGKNVTTTSKHKYDTIDHIIHENGIYIINTDTNFLYQSIYDLAGNCLEYSQLYKRKNEGYDDYKKICKYDKAGKCIEAKTYIHNRDNYIREDSTETIYTYNDRNLCSEEVFFNYADSDYVGSKTVYKYNDKNELTRETRYKSDGHIQYDNIYNYSNYDKYDNWLKKEEKSLYNGEKGRYLYDRAITYY